MTPRAVLVGLPGSGKTTAGQLLARRLQVEFADTDDLVVEATGRSVQEIFARDGEAGFRAAEAEVVAASLRAFDGVLALGGGAVTTASVRSALIAAGVPVVFLRTGMSALLARLGDGAGRPLLAGSPAARLAELAHERAPLYRQVSTGEVDTDDRSAAQVAAAVADQLGS